MIFSQGSRSRGRHHRRPGRGPGTAVRSGVATSPAVAGTGDPGGSPPSTPVPALAPGPVAAARASGPYDASQAPAGVDRWDLGSLQIPAVAGVQLRIQAAPDGAVRRVILLQGRSALHLAAFAAPRTESIWREVRGELSASLQAQQAEVEEAVGEFGAELRARVPVSDGFKLLRLVGVDGPRWLVRADFHGPAAVEPGAADKLAACLRGLVVDRGTEPRPVREPLPLRLSEEAVAQIQQQAAEPPRAGSGRGGS